MYRPKRWQMNPPQPVAARAGRSAQDFAADGADSLNRGISRFRRCPGVFAAKPAGTGGSGICCRGSAAAAARIAKAIRDREKIVIYGDYDVDGITATAILWHAITLLGGQVETYIPHRIDEGYGLNCRGARPDHR